MISLSLSLQHHRAPPPTSRLCRLDPPLPRQYIVAGSGAPLPPSLRSSGELAGRVNEATSGDSDAVSGCPVGSFHFEMEPAKMENFHVRLNSTDQIYQDSMYDRKSIFWQVDDQPCPRAEVICPQPCRATRIPYFMHSLNRVNGKPKGILQIHRVDCASEILDLLLSKDGFEGDSDSSSQVGFFCGSPPARTNNPVVHDSEFGKQSPFLDSPKGISPSMKQAGRVERGSPTCGSSPKMNVDKLMKMSGAVRTGGKGSMRRRYIFFGFYGIFVFSEYLHHLIQLTRDYLVTEFEDLLPGIINQLEPDNLENLKRFVEHLQKQSPSTATAAKQDNDDVPDLVPGETFEAAADENQAS
ncbi:hypothetical protein MUK42_01850 [Musa troglodytarum]|uniref:Uncharacterized protein n=1 Tax=Musa troglodytarum TaxID=320322 RepID=A0A9E7FHL1_9LILI|nr:hypothetical protein MUK42_01850 [Musa troglodytarum]